MKKSYLFQHSNFNKKLKKFQLCSVEYRYVTEVYGKSMEDLQNYRVQFNERSQQRSFPYQRLHPLCKEPIMQTTPIIYFKEPMIYCTYDILYETRRRATDSVVYITGKVFYEKFKK